jgi:hypothetical protein
VTSSAGPTDAAFDERLRLRQVILNVIPDNIDVSRVTGMAQPRVGGLSAVILREQDYLVVREERGFQAGTG